MNIDETIQSINNTIETLRQQKKFLESSIGHEMQSLKLDISLYAEYIDFDYPDRDATIALLKMVGGKWSKEPIRGAKINYKQKRDGFSIRIYGGAPPPNCTVVEKQVLIPAQPERYEVVRELSCPVGEL